MKKLLLTLTIVSFVFTSTFAWAGKLVIKGSTTVLPIAQKVSEAYMKEHPETRISISGGGSGNGIKSIIDGSTDIADSSRFIKKKEIKLAMKKGVYPVPFRVAYDCIIPIIHPSNTIKNLTLEQLKKIYQGKIKNWKDVGGPDRRIAVVSRDTSSGTYEVWEKKVMKKERVFPGAMLQASNGAVAQVVSKNKNAIGYIGIGYMEDTVRPVKVNNIEGSIANTLNGTFPISRPLFMFTQSWPEGEIINFLNYLLHPDKGQKLVSESGYVPLY
jgi:phosphate transport system substrate-binding protein